MDARFIVFGETAIEELVQWLRSTGEPQDIEAVIIHYLEILQARVLEDQES